MIGVGESANPLLTVMPVALMLFSGYTTGAIISKVRKKSSPVFIRDLIYGNVILNFLFISGFIIFGVLIYAANQYFTTFTYMLVGLSVIGIYLLLGKLILSIFHGLGIEYVNAKFKNIRSLMTASIHDPQSNVFVLFGIALFVCILTYEGIIIYFHPIFSEYDSIFRFLPISKSIILGNGLNHDFYLGSDVNIRFPPFIQAINAWLIHSFEYSSIRMFPIYYVFFTAILVYSFARNILIKTSGKGDASFFGLIAASAFLITPAILVTSSRFSLQHDIAFIYFLTASFYFLSEIVRYDKPAKTNLLMISASLALMILTREIGLAISIAIFFLVPAIKFTEGNLKLRFVFTVLSFITLYLLSIKDLLEFGLTYTTSFRLITLLLANSAIYYILSRLKNQNKFSSLISQSNLKYLVPLVIPLIFVVGNLIIFSGPYPNFTFSGKISENLPIYRDISGVTNPLALDIFQAVRNLPRIDVLFISIAVGSAFLFFKLLGLGKIIYRLKNNYEFSLVLILLLLLLVTWSFLLQSGFETSDIRHIAYFIPLMSVILVVGMKIKAETKYPGKIFYYGVVVLATLYFLFSNLYTWNYNNHFGGFWIEPNLGTIMSFNDYRFAAVIIGGLILVELGEQKILTLIRRPNPAAFSTVALAALLILEIYVLSHSGIMLAPQEKLDAAPPKRWETNLFEVINYLNVAEKGNVLSIRAPAIPFFTNRTNFDLFNPQTFSYSISPLLLTENSSALEQKLSNLGIKYIVIPNERNPQYHLVVNLRNQSNLLQLINSDVDFDRISFQQFDLYRFDQTVDRVSLLDDNQIWRTTKNTTLNQKDGNLNILTITNERNSVDNFAFTTTQANISQTPILLSLNYASKSILGTATFRIELYDMSSQMRLFTGLLNNTSGNLINQTFVLPKSIMQGSSLELRLIVSTNSPGEHTLNFRKIILT
jgi:hypothetical protein